jgi:hypothetical protein
VEPLTEHRLVSGPVVYGFLRLVRVSAARQDALMASLVEYCRRHELLLSGVFVERAPSGIAAFAGLLDVLALPGTYGAVAPAASHLGTKATARERQDRIEALGSRLVLMRRARRWCVSSGTAAEPMCGPPVSAMVADEES